MAAKSTSFRLGEADLALLAEGKQLLQYEQAVDVVRYCLRETIRRLRLEKVVKPKIVEDLRKELMDVARAAVKEERAKRRRRRRAARVAARATRPGRSILKSGRTT